MDCKKKENEAKCLCPNNDCPRHGTCCQCVAYHRENKNLPVCLRSK